MTHGLVLPPGVKAHTGAERWAVILEADTLRLPDGRILRDRGERIPMGFGVVAKVFRGPQGLTVLVSLDAPRDALPALLHVSISLPRGYPDWDTIYGVCRATFGPDVDAMMPIPREAAFIHGVTEGQKAGRERQVFHLSEMPQAWPSEF